MTKQVRTRIAPSPTGYATIGNLRTALFNYLFAKHYQGDFILRIEDTDTERFVVGAEEYMIKSLQWLGIMPNEGIDENGQATYRQSEKEYVSFVNILLEKKIAYYAFDTDDELVIARDNAEKNSKNKRLFSRRSSLYR